MTQIQSQFVSFNATAPEELTRESEDPGAAPAMEETYPILPHLEFSEEELEIRHPSLKAPAEERLEDVLRDCDDVVYNHGLAIAREIQEEVAELGRRRHAVPDKERLDAVSAQEVTEKETEKEMDIPSDAVFTAGRQMFIDSRFSLIDFILEIELFFSWPGTTIMHCS